MVERMVKMVSPADTILERKLSLCRMISEGLPRRLRLKLRIMAIEQAQEESGADFSAMLEVLRSADEFRTDGSLNAADVSRVLTAIRNTEGLGTYRQGYLYIDTNAFTQLAFDLHVSRQRVLREMAGMGC